MCWHTSLHCLLLHLCNLLLPSVAPFHHAQIVKLHTETLFTPESLFPVKFLGLSSAERISLCCQLSLPCGFLKSEISALRFIPERRVRVCGKCLSQSRGKRNENDPNHVQTPTCIHVHSRQIFSAMSKSLQTPLPFPPGDKQKHNFLPQNTNSLRLVKWIGELSYCVQGLDEMSPKLRMFIAAKEATDAWKFDRKVQFVEQDHCEVPWCRVCQCFFIDWIPPLRYILLFFSSMQA